MAYDLDALRELLAKVVAGDDAGFRQANRAVFSTPCQDMALQLREENSRYAYKGSLNAAQALHEAVLPKGQWPSDRWMLWQSGDKYGCSIIDGIDTHYADTRARAWLIAILGALIAEAELEAA